MVDEIHTKCNNNVILCLILSISLIIYTYFNFDLNYFDYNNDWKEPLSTRGGQKIEKSLESAFICSQAYFQGTNLRSWERYKQAQNQCKELIYYMRYGFMMEWILNIVLYILILVFTTIIAYIINKNC